MEALEFSEMSAALAHEIKNPAAVALAHVNLLRLESPDEKITHHLNHIENALNDICGLVREMLQVACNRDDAYEIDLYRILAEILETYRSAWPEISFSLNLAEIHALELSDEPVLPCFGHETSLRMIFSNLIKNAVEAVEFAEIAGEIKIDAEYAEDFLKITICDNGASCESAQKPHGNGLGLTICQSLANGIGATLSSKTAKTGGRVVTVRLRTRCPSFA